MRPVLTLSRGRLVFTGACSLVFLMAAMSLPAAVLPSAEVVTGAAALYRLDLLPAFKPSVAVGSVSSYDRTGGNDDGFSGRYSFVRREDDGLVLADLQGPGVIHRIWTPTPTDDLLEFYFDGEPEPRLKIKFRELFLGKHPRFPSPLSGYGAGGFYTYVPISFAHSCKILARADKIQFFQINYSRYPDTMPVQTFEPNPSATTRLELERAVKTFASAGTDLTESVVPPEARRSTFRTNMVLAPGASTTLFRSDEPGRIAAIRLSPASALAGKDRATLLRIRFDGQAPSVSCPAGDFFGFAWDEPAMKSLLVGTVGDTCYSYFPMPYRKSVQIELVSESTEGAPRQLKAEVVTANAPRRADEGGFYAVWRRENPTTPGQPFTFIETEGRGHLVGFILQAQGKAAGKTLFFEGDDQTAIDGDVVIHGTGSEDFFNGGWYDVPDRWEKRISFPLTGCLGYQKPLGRTGGYRLLLGDAYAYGRSIRQTIEHGGENNSEPADYCAVTYLYSEERPSAPLAAPPLDQRAVFDPVEAVFPAWWQTPIYAWTFDNASLSRGKLKIDGTEVRFLGFRAKGSDWSGPPFLSLTCAVPVTGKYDVFIEAVRGPESGRVQLFENEAPAGEPVDLYAAKPARSGRIRLGTLRMTEGKNNVMFKIVGKHAETAEYGLDLITVICRR